MLYVALFFAIVSGTIMYVFVRPIDPISSTGTIESKEHKPEGVTWQYVVPTGGRGFNSPTPIRTAEGTILQISVPGWEEPVRTFVGLLEGESLKIGQGVEFKYIRRSFLFWSRIYVTEISRPEY